jgi:hypothetical protein
MELESTFFGEMRKLIGETLGSRALVVGTSDFTYGISSYALAASSAQLDMLDAHAPWELRPIVNEPFNSIVVRLSRSAMAGKPLMVSEHNHRFPNDYTSEGIPLLAAYGAFQDWDAIFLYTFEAKERGYVPYNGTRADLSHDPVKIPNLAAGALMFLRGDVRTARETVLRSYTREQVTESMRLPSGSGVYFTPGFPLSAPLLHGSRIGSLDGPAMPPVTLPVASPLVADTGELAWYFKSQAAPVTVEMDQKFSTIIGAGKTAATDGMVTVDTPKTQALIGFLSAQNRAVTHLKAEVKNRFATLVLTSLDGKPIAQAGRLLFNAGARVTNTGLEWNAARTAVTKWGGPPTLIEPVAGKVVVRKLEGVKALRVTPLDGSGRRMNRTLPARRTADGFEFTLGNPVTTWYEVRAER